VERAPKHSVGDAVEKEEIPIVHKSKNICKNSMYEHRKQLGDWFCRTRTKEVYDVMQEMLSSS
jgi:hypothetical protein